MGSRVISIVYIVVGVIMANNYGYLGDLNNLGTLPHIVSGILAVALWPLLLVGVNLNVVF